MFRGVVLYGCDHVVQPVGRTVDHVADFPVSLDVVEKSRCRSRVANLREKKDDGTLSVSLFVEVLLAALDDLLQGVLALTRRLMEPQRVSQQTESGTDVHGWGLPAYLSIGDQNGDHGFIESSRTDALLDERLDNLAAQPAAELGPGSDGLEHIADPL